MDSSSSLNHPESSIQNQASRIDSHQHFWKYNPVRDSWITDVMNVIQRDFFPEDLSRVLSENRIDGCVSVQADQSDTETHFLLELADRNPFIKGVVGWTDLRSNDLEERLVSYSNFPKLKGFRHVVQGEPNGFLLQKDFVKGVKKLIDFNFTYDILVYSRQLEEVLEFLNKFPNQKFVIDHIAKPNIKAQEIDSWKKNMALISNFENVFCKISGMVTEADWKNWKTEDFRPYLDHILESFGSNRLMYGSDWPVCLVAASYAQQLSLVETYISKLSVDEKENIMGGNAIRFYNL